MNGKSITSSTLGDIAVDTRQNRAQTAVATGAGGWGWLPALSFVGALGLLVEAQAMRLALRDVSYAPVLFWVGLVLLYAPAAFRLAMPRVTRRERIALLVWLGLALYVVKVLRSPTGFVFHDEFAHWRTASDILQTGHLFRPNSLQGTSAVYPGLEIVTAALASVSGLSIFAAGLVLVGAARLLAGLVLYLIFEEISQSGRIASLAAVLGIAYPNYLFWSSQFAYESLALPLAMLAFYLALALVRRGDRLPGLKLATVLVLCAVVITHHVTSYVLTALFVGAYLVTRYSGRVTAGVGRLAARLPVPAGGQLEQASLQAQEVPADPSAWGRLALLALVVCLTWLVFVGQQTIGYLSPHLQAAARGVGAVVGREQAAKQLFGAPSAALATPFWERLLAFASVGLVAIGLPFGLFGVWRRYRSSPMALLLAAATLSYPLSLLLRLTTGGTEISNRSWDFLFIPTAFVLAVAIGYFWSGRKAIASSALLIAGYASVLFAGAVVVGMQPWARLPGPYLVGGDTRGLQAESYAGADWVLKALGPNHRVVTDSTNKLLLGSYGQQDVLDGASWVFFSPSFRSADELRALVQDKVQFIVVDKRVTTGLPRTGVYYEQGEPDAGQHTQPLEPALLAKFDSVTCFSRIFDSGNIVIYSVGSACAAR